MSTECFTTCCSAEPRHTPEQWGRQKGGSVDEFRLFVISCASEASAGENWLPVLKAQLS